MYNRSMPIRPLHSAVTVLVLCLTACRFPLPGLVPAPSLTPLPSATFTVTQHPTSTFTPEPTLTPTLSPTPRPNVSRVLIVSFDGLRPDVIDLTPMTSLQGLIENGAYSLTAQTIFPSSTLPSHASMLTGSCPDEHKVNWNDYIPSLGFALGTDLFDLAQAAGLRTVMIAGKEKLRQVTEPASTDVFWWVNDRDLIVAERTAPYIAEGFDLMFVHFATIDDMGHSYGWLSPQQFSVAYRGDQALQILLDALGQSGMLDTTLIIVTADHGGHDTTHGSSLPEDMTIPWIASGPGIHPIQLTSRINTTDTAATAAWALGLPLPSEWAGRPVYEAFGLPDPAGTDRPQPRCQ
jgi:arylsulfatase A-like enzyme